MTKWKLFTTEAKSLLVIWAAFIVVFSIIVPFLIGLSWGYVQFGLWLFE